MLCLGKQQDLLPFLLASFSNLISFFGAIIAGEAIVVCVSMSSNKFIAPLQLIKVTHKGNKQ